MIQGKLASGLPFLTFEGKEEVINGICKVIRSAKVHNNKLWWGAIGLTILDPDGEFLEAIYTRNITRSLWNELYDLAKMNGVLNRISLQE